MIEKPERVLLSDMTPIQEIKADDIRCVVYVDSGTPGQFSSVKLIMVDGHVNVYCGDDLELALEKAKDIFQAEPCSNRIGFCAFCKVRLTDVPESCQACGNRRFCFLTGQVRLEETIGLSEFDKLSSSDVDIVLREGLYVSRERPVVRTDWMQYIDTRTGRTWWAPFEVIEFKIRQLKDFSGSQSVWV